MNGDADDRAHDLARFLRAQESVIDDVRAELAAGRKRTHWMWFVFPQLRGLGRSETARFYGLGGAAEAAAFAAHRVLGARLCEASGLMLSHRGREAAAILGATDAMKLRSSATLFAALPGAHPVHGEVLDAFYGGARCPLTLERLG